MFSGDNMALTHCGFFAALIFLLAGCSATSTAPQNQGAVPMGDTTAAMTAEKSKDSNDSQRLTALWEKRMREQTTNDYPIGPGDVIEINVPGMEEIKNMSERINGDGTLSLPFVGVIQVTGMTDKSLRDEIRRRLEEKYMKNPQINLFVKEFRSRQVAVIGAVQKPGLYNLASPFDTLLTMISQAGGMKVEAAERVLFVPAEPVESGKAAEIVKALPSQVVRQDPAPLILKNVDPINISLDSMSRGSNERFLQMPARPGDIIMVPGGGEVLVQGWVEKPGSFKITPGLTILGAVAAAGGPSFPADTGAVQLIRTEKSGQKAFFTANLDAIKNGSQPDLPVREGDVVDVSSSGGKLAAYGIYRFFTSIMSVGASIPVR